jgi:hypothetical protein
LPIPDEPGEWMELRPLSYFEIAEARTAEMKAAIALVGDMPESVTSLARPSEDAERASVAAEPDPLAGLDLGTVLRLGIIAWSYPEEANEKNIKLLSEDTALWAAEQIVGLRSKASTGNISAPSTQL